MSRRSLLMTCLSILLCLPSSSWSHARLMKSIPARRAVLSTPPTRVQLWFNEPLEARFSQLSVWNAAGQRVDEGDLQVDPQDAKKLSLNLPRLKIGRYTVKFRVLSVDSHLITNQFSFTVEPTP